MAMKDIAASILARLKNQAKETGLSYQMCLQLFCQEEFLRRLSLSQYNSNFVLKGGLFIYTLTEFQSRATQDIDFLMRQLSNDIDKVKGVIEEIIQVPTTNDYIKIEVVNAEIITPDKEYQGVSVKFIGRIKQVKIPFSIDIGMNDVIVPKAVKRCIKTRLTDFEEPEVYTYSLESTIAEKFDAILKRMEATSRMKDFFIFTICPVCLILMGESYRKPSGKQYNIGERFTKQTVLNVFLHSAIMLFYQHSGRDSNHPCR